MNGQRQSIRLGKRNSLLQVLVQDIVLNQVLKELNIEKAQAEQLRNLFNRIDNSKSGNIKPSDCSDILENFEFKYSKAILKKKVNHEIQQRKINKIDFLQLCQIFLAIKKLEKDELEQEEAEFIDAFVALGGNPDKTGFVKKSKIIEIIKKEFELTIDIEDLIDSTPNGNQTDDLNFQDFCQMFESGGEEIKSKVSLLSSLSGRNPKSNTNLNEKTFNVKYKDFEIWLENQENQGKKV